MLTFLLGTLRGQYIVLTAFLTGLVTTAALLWQAVSISDSGEAALMGWRLLMDPGTVGNVEGATDGQNSIIVVFSSVGVIMNLVFTGVVVDNIRQILEKIKQIYEKVQFVDHFVILGWTPKSLFLVHELVAMLEDSKSAGSIVIMSTQEKSWMEDQISLAMNGRHPQVPPSIKIQAWPGNPLQESDLLKLNLTRARAVVCVSDHPDHRQADDQILETVTALKNIKVRCQLVVETRTREGLAVMSEMIKLTQMKILPALVCQLSDSVVASTAGNPPAGLAMVELLGFVGNDFSVIECKAGKTFVQASVSLPNVVACGIQRGSHIFAPPASNAMLAEGDRLVVLSKNRVDAEFQGERKRSSGSVLIVNRRPSRSLHINDALNILIIGDDFHTALSTLDSMLPRLSVVHVLSKFEPEESEYMRVHVVHHSFEITEQSLASMHLTQFFSALVLADKGIGTPCQRDARVLSTSILLHRLSPFLKIIPVYEDFSSVRLFSRMHIQSSTALHRNSIESGLLGLMVSDPALSETVQEIVSNSRISAIPASEIGITTVRSLSFWHIFESLFEEEGHILLGFCDDLTPCLNPPLKHLVQSWHPECILIILLNPMYQSPGKAVFVHRQIDSMHI